MNKHTLARSSCGVRLVTLRGDVAYNVLGAIIYGLLLWAMCQVTP